MFADCFDVKPSIDCWSAELANMGQMMYAGYPSTAVRGIGDLGRSPASVAQI